MSSSVQTGAGDYGDEKSGAPQQRPQKKGTFASYEALMSTGRGDPQELRSHRSETTVQSRYEPVGKTRSRDDTARPAKTESPISVLIERIVSQNGKGWPADMVGMGELANALSRDELELSPAQIAEVERVLDYKGVPFYPPDPPSGHRVPFSWVKAAPEEDSVKGTTMLSQEIQSFGDFMKPTLAEEEARYIVKQTTMDFISDHIGAEVKPSLFGSERTGLASAISDVDFRVQVRHPATRGRGRNANDKLDNELVLQQMRKLVSKMRESSNYLSVVLRNARYPIINAQHRQTGVDVQIVSSPSTLPQHDLMQYYLRSIPNLKTLFFVVKYMLATRGLIDVFYGGTGSYGLFMMLVASLTRRGDSYVNAEPGVQLLRFLDFYCEHKYESNGISIGRAPDHLEGAAPAHATIFRKRGPMDLNRATLIRHASKRGDLVRAGQWAIGQVRPFQPYLPCIQDAANPRNDLGRKMNGIKHIVATLRKVREDLRAGIARVDGGQWCEGESLLEPVVGRCHEIYAERRRRLEEFGNVAPGRVRDKIASARRGRRDRRQGGSKVRMVDPDRYADSMQAGRNGSSELPSENREHDSPPAASVRPAGQQSQEQQQDDLMRVHAEFLREQEQQLKRPQPVQTAWEG